MIKKCKWLIFPVVILLLMLQLVPLSAAITSSDPQVTAGNTAGTPGGTVKLTLVLSGVEKANTIGIKFTYDATKVKLTESSRWLCPEESLSKVDVVNNNAIWTNEESLDLNGSIFEAVFKVGDKADLGSVSIVSNVTVKNGKTEVLTQDVRSFISIVSGVSVSGTYKCFGNDEDKITIELLKDGKVIDTQELTGNTGTYSFIGVEVGGADYVVRAKKTKHCPREYKIDVAGGDVTQNVEILLYGDILGDGRVNSEDATQIARYDARKSTVLNTLTEEEAEYRLLVANVTNVLMGDNRVNSEDATQIVRCEAGKTSVFDHMQ